MFCLPVPATCFCFFVDGVGAVRPPEARRAQVRLLAWGTLPFPPFQVKFTSHSFHLNQGLLWQLSLLAFMAWNPGLPTPSSRPSPGPGKAFIGVSAGIHLPGLPGGSHWPLRPLQEQPSSLQPGQGAGSRGGSGGPMPWAPGWLPGGRGLQSPPISEPRVCS